VGFHDQALGEQGRRPVADGCGLGGPGEVNRLIRAGQVERLVRMGGEDLCRKGMRAGDAAGFGAYLDGLRERQRRKYSFIAKLDAAFGP
jgi:hypothetical protein